MGTSTRLDLENRDVGKTTSKIDPKASASFSSVVGRRSKNLAPNLAIRAAGFGGYDPERIHETDLVSVLFEADDQRTVEQIANRLKASETVENLVGNIWSARVGDLGARYLLAEKSITRIQTKKLSKPNLDQTLSEISLISGKGKRLISEDGQGVLIGVIDSGFDLSHPAFFDGSNNLRVDALLDQQDGGRVYSRAQLKRGWTGGKPGPGDDWSGHGTHVASIAGGTKFKSYEGVAPGARFLLVRTNFLDTDEAVRWVFDKATALGKPCVINMSLGHHHGAHDGTDLEERTHRDLIEAGKIIVIAAGNERDDSIHIGRNFNIGEGQEVFFDFMHQSTGQANAIISLWHSEHDLFDVSIVAPDGQTFGLPPMNHMDNHDLPGSNLEIVRKGYSFGHAHQIQYTLDFNGPKTRGRDLKKWRFRIECKAARVGRLDGWFNNSGYGMFRKHPMVENHRTVGICATGEGCLAVASHITKTGWDSSRGPIEDRMLVAGRSSDFSSLGPTRDGRCKPDISAPGQYVTAALADRSELATLDGRAHVGQRMVTIEGTSMAAPVITGVIALMLQKKPSLTLVEARAILRETAHHDDCTGQADWNPTYGFGKVDVAAAIAKLS